MQPEPSKPQQAAWPTWPALLFLAMLVAVAAIGWALSRSDPRVVSGLPQAPQVHEAAHQARDRLRVETGGLRLETALLGENQQGHVFSAANLELAGRVDSLLDCAAALGAEDPRITAARASLALACRDYAAAIRSYRKAVDRAAAYGEARLGLGVALALHAETLADSRARRSAQLRALAQFANVRRADPAFEAALYNRVLMLARVERREEAQRFQASYRMIDDSSAWADALARELGSL